jgi:hypothetical protein
MMLLSFNFFRDRFSEVKMMPLLFLNVLQYYLRQILFNTLFSFTVISLLLLRS